MSKAKRATDGGEIIYKRILMDGRPAGCVKFIRRRDALRRANDVIICALAHHCRSAVNFRIHFRHRFLEG